MAVICWGNLGKTADDNIRIEQSMQAYVEDHNENPNAHQIEGSSLYMHRVNEAIDHLDGSVSLVKLMMNKAIYITAFESIDAWSTTGYVYNTISELFIAAQVGDTGEAYAIGGGGFSGTLLVKEKYGMFQTNVKVVSNTSQEVYFGFGKIVEMEGDGFCGFRIINATLYATEGSETAHTDHEITGITVTDNHVYRVVYDYANSKIVYYVDGVIKHTTNTFTEMEDANVVFTYYISRDVEAQRVLIATDLIIEIEK